MGFTDILKSILLFDKTPGSFELLETEYGEPNRNHRRARLDDDMPERDKVPKTPTVEDISENIKHIRRRFNADKNSDIIIREFSLGGRFRAAAVMINGIVNSEFVDNFILRPGMVRGVMDSAVSSFSQYAAENVFALAEVRFENDFSSIENLITNGHTVIFIDGDSQCAAFDTRSYPQRGVQTPENEKTVLGPKSSFNENIRTNISLIRSLVHTDDLVCEMRQYGNDNCANLALVYRDGVTNSALLEEVKRKLGDAKVFEFLSTGMLEQIIENNKFTPIPQVLLTERPDRCASFLVKGHIVLICDGTPLAAVLPITLFTLLSSPEDTYERAPLGTILRLFRYIGAMVSVFAPGIFMAIVMFHQGFLSSEVLTTLIAARKMVYVSMGVELLILLMIFQLVREAGLRVPGTTGQVIGIMGGVLLGQAAVSANLVSTVALILIALTGLGNFCIADHSTQIAAVYIRIALVIGGWLGGFLGVSVVTAVIVAHLAALKSFGVPFLSPYAPKAFSKRGVLFRGTLGDKLKPGTDYMNSRGAK